MTGISKSQVSRLCEGNDERVKSFPERPIEGDWSYLWLDTTHIEVRRAGCSADIRGATGATVRPHRLGGRHNRRGRQLARP